MESIAKSVVTEQLKHYCGEFLLGFHDDLLQFSGGVATLQQLTVNPQAATKALYHAGVPVAVKAGHIQELRITVNFNHPLDILVDGFYLLLGPHYEDSDLSKLVKNNDKQYTSEALRISKRMFGDVENNSQLDEGENPLNDLLQQLPRVSLNLNNVHIRFEDDVSTPRPVCFGLVLENFRVDTTASHRAWNPQLEGPPVASFSPAAAGSNYVVRQLEVRGLAIYSDPAAAPYVPSSLYEATKDDPWGIFSAMGMDQLLEMFKNGMTKGHSYIIPPTYISGQLNLRLDSSSGESKDSQTGSKASETVSSTVDQRNQNLNRRNSRDSNANGSNVNSNAHSSAGNNQQGPKVLLMIETKALEINVDIDLVEDAVNLLHYVRQFKLWQALRSHRPKEKPNAVHQNAAAWWQYVVKYTEIVKANRCEPPKTFNASIRHWFQERANARRYIKMYKIRATTSDVDLSDLCSAMGISFNPTEFNYCVELTPAAFKWFFEFEISNSSIYSIPLLRMLALAELAWDVQNQAQNGFIANGSGRRPSQKMILDEWIAPSKWTNGFDPDAIGLRANPNVNGSDGVKLSIARATEPPRWQVYRDILRRWYEVNPEDIVNMQGLDLAWDDPYKLYKHFLPAWKHDEVEIEEDEHIDSIQGRARSIKKALDATKFQVELPAVVRGACFSFILSRVAINYCRAPRTLRSRAIGLVVENINVRISTQLGRLDLRYVHDEIAVKDFRFSQSGKSYVNVDDPTEIMKAGVKWISMSCHGSCGMDPLTSLSKQKKSNLESQNSQNSLVDVSWQAQEPRYTVVKLNLGLTFRYLVRLPMMINFYVRMATIYVSLFPPSMEFLLKELAKAKHVFDSLKLKVDQFAYLRTGKVNRSFTRPKAPRRGTDELSLPPDRLTSADGSASPASPMHGLSPATSRAASPTNRASGALFCIFFALWGPKEEPNGAIFVGQACVTNYRVHEFRKGLSFDRSAGGKTSTFEPSASGNFIFRRFPPTELEDGARCHRNFPPPSCAPATLHCRSPSPFFFMLSFSNFAEAWPESMNPRAADTGIDGYIKRCSSEGELYDAFTQVLRQIDGSAVDVQLLFPAEFPDPKKAPLVTVTVPPPYFQARTIVREGGFRKISLQAFGASIECSPDLKTQLLMPVLLKQVQRRFQNWTNDLSLMLALPRASHSNFLHHPTGVAATVATAETPFQQLNIPREDSSPGRRKGQDMHGNLVSEAKTAERFSGNVPRAVTARQKFSPLKSRSSPSKEGASSNGGSRPNTKLKISEVPKDESKQSIVESVVAPISRELATPKAVPIPPGEMSSGGATAKKRQAPSALPKPMAESSGEPLAPEITDDTLESEDTPGTVEARGEDTNANSSPEIQSARTALPSEAVIHNLGQPASDSVPRSATQSPSASPPVVPSPTAYLGRPADAAGSSYSSSLPMPHTSLPGNSLGGQFAMKRNSFGGRSSLGSVGHPSPAAYVNAITPKHLQPLQRSSLPGNPSGFPANRFQATMHHASPDSSTATPQAPLPYQRASLSSSSGVIIPPAPIFRKEDSGMSSPSPYGSRSPVRHTAGISKPNESSD